MKHFGIEYPKNRILFIQKCFFRPRFFRACNPCKSYCMTSARLLFLFKKLRLESFHRNDFHIFRDFKIFKEFGGCSRKASSCRTGISLCSEIYSHFKHIERYPIIGYLPMFNELFIFIYWICILLQKLMLKHKLSPLKFQKVLIKSPELFSKCQLLMQVEIIFLPQIGWLWTPVQISQKDQKQRG